MSGRPILIWLLLVAATGAAIFWLNDRFPWALASDYDFTRLIYLLCWLVLAGGGVLYVAFKRPARAVRDILIWSGLFLTLIVGHSYRDVFQDVSRRLRGELMPNSGMANPDGTLTFTAASDGHFYIEAMVEGTPVLFLVDTGATMVVLSPADAQRIGFDVANLTFSSMAETANGIVRGAPVKLRNIEIEGFRFTDVAAEVNQAEMGQSLLGMSVLSRVGFDVRGDKLTLHP